MRTKQTLEFILQLSTDKESQSNFLYFLLRHIFYVFKFEHTAKVGVKHQSINRTCWRLFSSNKWNFKEI